MDNSGSRAGEPPADPNPTPAAPAGSSALSGVHSIDVAAIVSGDGSRRPFTELSQVDADLALARVLQEQERAYMMLRMGSDFDGSDGESYNYDEIEDGGGEEEVNEADVVAPDGHAAVEEGDGEGQSIEGSEYEEEDEIEVDVDPAEFDDDESYARALQDAEEREVAARLLALTGLSEWRPVEHEEIGSDPQDAWEEVDPDNYSYEELIALGEVVGTEGRGLPTDTIASLPSVVYKSSASQEENNEQCVVCRVEYEEGDCLVMLPCKHMYHSECINQWLQINKVCPMCSSEVSASRCKQQEGNSEVSPSKSKQQE